MSMPILQKLDYRELPLPERCCKRCAFFISEYGNFQSCAYMNALNSLADAHEIDSYAVCNHFFSIENAKLFKDCSSPEEFDLKLTIFGIDLDSLLLTELKDGFATFKKATAKMIEYALLIHKILFPLNKEKTDLPVSINVKSLCNFSNVMLDPVNPLTIQLSQNFHRIAAYIKNNKESFKQHFAFHKQISSFDAYCKENMI